MPLYVKRWSASLMMYMGTTTILSLLLTLSCPQLDELYTAKAEKLAHHTAWMDANCAGDRELTVPVCKSMSSLLLEELDEMADIRRVQKIRCDK